MWWHLFRYMQLWFVFLVCLKVFPQSLGPRLQPAHHQILQAPRYFVDYSWLPCCDLFLTPSFIFYSYFLFYSFSAALWYSLFFGLCLVYEYLSVIDILSLIILKIPRERDPLPRAGLIFTTSGESRSSLSLEPPMWLIVPISNHPTVQISKYCSYCESIV